MKFITLNHIKNHPKTETTWNWARDIEKKIIGRICMSSYIHTFAIIKELLANQCKTYLEIGTLFGGSMALMMQSQYKTKFIGVDIFNYYGEAIDPISNVEIKKETTKANIDRFNKYKHPYVLIDGNSHEPETVERVKRETPNGVDLFLIDGDHTGWGVMQDFHYYEELVNPWGIIIFDNYGDPQRWMGVKKAIELIDFNDWHVLGQNAYSFIVQKLP